MSKDRTSLISGDEWVNSLKNLGLTTSDSVCELVDNSLDASAKSIHISIIEPEKKKITFIVEDDGIGIPDDKIDKVLAFGGRMQSKNVASIGKFGWGLSSAITCQANRGEVYSKVKKAGEYSFCYIDLNELKSEKTPLLPEPSKADPNEKYPLQLSREEHGTVVILKDCDAMDLDWHSKDKIISELMRTLGETYRKHLVGGISIFVNGKPVKPIDPLLLMPGAFSEKYEKSRHYKDVTIEIPEVIDPETNEAAKIRIKLVMLDPSVTDVKDPEKQLKLGMTNQGFYLMRHDRQIGRAITLDIYTRNAHYNFFRGEVSFPSCLDKYFGIQTNKSRFSLKEGLRDKMLDALKGMIPQMEIEFRKAKTELLALLEKHKIKESEKIAAEAAKVMKKTEIVLPPRKIEAYEKSRKLEKEKDLQRVELDDSLKPDEKMIIKKEIENEFQTRMPFKMKLQHIETGHFYLVHPVGNGQVEIILNTAHPFFQKVYEKAQQDEIAKYLDLLIFTLAKAEMDFWSVSEVKRFYEQQKGTWSALLATFLSYSE